MIGHLINKLELSLKKYPPSSRFPDTKKVGLNAEDSLGPGLVCVRAERTLC